MSELLCLITGFIVGATFVLVVALAMANGDEED